MTYNGAKYLAASALAVTLLVAPHSTGAADQLLSGKKLLIKNPAAGAASNKLVHLAKDVNITIGAAGGAGDPQCAGAGGGGSSSLRVTASGGIGETTIALPCAGWTTNGRNGLYRYEDPTGATCRLVLVKSGVLVKTVCRGSQVAIDLDASAAPVTVETTLNTQKYCTRFGGTAVKDGSDDRTFLHRDANAPTCCLPGCEVPFPLPGDDPGVQVDGVGRDADGDLVRDASALANRFLWIPNDREGTVSKIDPVSGAEIARYASVTHDAARLVDHVLRSFPAWNGDANSNTYADNRPQYTAVDFAGDAWVANVVHDVSGLQPTLTKIRGSASACPDLNGNGMVDTSREVNGTPGIQLTDPLEFFAEDDECIAMTVVVGDLVTTVGTNAGARALAIDAGRSVGNDAGNPWVGMHGEQAFYQLHGATGAILQRVPTPGVSPFTAAIDSRGRLWARHHCCGPGALALVDTTLNPAPFTPITTQPPFTGVGHGGYGLAVDLANRVWVAGYPYAGLMRYDPDLLAWTEAQITGFFATWHARGVAVDGRGNVWTSMHSSSTGDSGAARVDADTAVSTGVFGMDDSSGGAPSDVPPGVGIDFAGNVWTANQATSNVSRLHIDPATGDPAAHPATGDIVDVFPVGQNPYVHSDFTGLGYRRVTRPDGEYRVRLASCPGGPPAHWITAEWEATTPEGTRVELWLRASDDPASVEQAPLQGPWTTSPANLQSAPGPVADRVVLQLILRLVSEDPGVTPIVDSYRVTRTCPAP